MRIKCWLMGCTHDPETMILIGGEDDVCIRCGALHEQQYLSSLRLRLRTLLPYRLTVENRTGKVFDKWGHRQHFGATPCGYLAVVDIEEERFWKYPHPFKQGDTVFVFGDIDQMPYHCVFATRDGKIHWGYDTGYFRRLTDEEA